MAKQNLLVVDADPRSLRVLEVSLRNAGYNVAGCPSVGKAFEILHANKPDLILSDTTFSDLNGFEFVEQLRQNSEWSEIPFMFLSSDGSIESKIRGLELGVQDYLTKPIYIREVVARVGIELDDPQRRLNQVAHADFQGQLGLDVERLDGIDRRGLRSHGAAAVDSRFLLRDKRPLVVEVQPTLLIRCDVDRRPALPANRRFDSVWMYPRQSRSPMPKKPL